MVKEIEKSGMPIVHMVNMVPVSKGNGANRIVKTYAIAYPMHDANESPEIQKKQRYEIVGKALQLLNTDIQDQTVAE